MKIDEATQGTQSISISQKQGKKELGKIDFQTVLNVANAKQNCQAQGISASASKEERNYFSPSALSVAPMNKLLNSGEGASVRSIGIQTAENALKTLEAYQEALGSPEISLKIMHSFVQALSLEVDRLKALSEQIPVSDPLHRMITETGIISAIEVAKFDRGEYL